MDDRVTGTEHLLRALSEGMAGVAEDDDYLRALMRTAAAILGLEPSTLRYRMPRLGIQRRKRGEQA